MKLQKGKVILAFLFILVCFAAALMFLSHRADTEENNQNVESGTTGTSQSFSTIEATQSSVFTETEKTYGFELVIQNENDTIKYGVSDGHRTVIPCEYDEISFLSETRILAQSHNAGEIGKALIYDNNGNIICDAGIFTSVIFDKTEGVYEQTGIGIYKKSSDLRQAEYWVTDQNGNKLSEAYTHIERIFSTLPEEAYYAVRIDPDSLYMSSYQLKMNGEVLEEVIHSHPDGVKDRTVISGKSGNCILLYADGYYITGYNNRIGGYDYVAIEVDNVDDWQIGDEVEITHTGKIRYSDPPAGELIDIVKISG